MPDKKRFGKKSKLKRKMKGGSVDDGSAVWVNEDKSPMSEAPVARNKQMENPPVATNKQMKNPPVVQARQVKSKVGSSRDDYGSLNMQFFLYAVASLGVVGIAWLLISRSLIRHEYSESLSYGLVSLAVFLSFFLVLISGLKSISAGKGLVDGIKYLLKVVWFTLTKCLPAILILIQCVVLIYITSKHANYLYTSDSIPALFNTFNIMAAVMIMGQSYAWYKQVNKIMMGGSGNSNPAQVPGFILAAILCTIAISQMYVILEFLKTDC